MCRFARQSTAKAFIVATEIGILHRLQQENPDKAFVPATEQAVCMNMKRITLEKVLWTLEELRPAVAVPEAIRVPAAAALQRMLDVS
jgi:quinolinate synthase